MVKKTYKSYLSEEITLRDRLATERTALANERTLLSYVRTMIAIVAVGGTLIKFFSGAFFVLSGFTLITLGFIVLIVGFTRYMHMQNLINAIEDHKKEGLNGDSLQHFLWETLRRLHLVRLEQ